MDPIEQRAAVVAEAWSWHRTPYHHHGRIKGVGVDCGMLLAEVYERAGVVAHVDAGEYSTQWHLHRDEDVYLSVLERFAAPVQAPAPGDIAVFKFGRTFSHGAIFVNADQVLHAYLGACVMLTRLAEEPLAGRECRFYSPWSA